MIAVVGAGLMGAATAWQLARRGHEVTLIEAYDIGHKHGSSHGTSRIFRRGVPRPLLRRLTGQAHEQWRELEDDSSTPLLRTTGGLDMGEGRDPEALAAAPGRGRGAPRTPRPGSRRRSAGRTSASPARCCTTRTRASSTPTRPSRPACGGRSSTARKRLIGARVTGIDVQDGEKVLLRTDDGREIVADTVVIAAGAWLPDLELPVPLPPLRVTQQQVFHFRQRMPSVRWPTLVCKDDCSSTGCRPAATAARCPR